MHAFPFYSRPHVSTTSITKAEIPTMFNKAHVTVEVMESFNLILQVAIAEAERLGNPDLALGLAQIKLENNQRFLNQRQDKECQKTAVITSI
jgi:hypothetical protein